MVVRCVLVVCLAGAIGCGNHSKDRSVERSPGRIYVPLGKTKAAAKVGDEVILDVGRSLQSPAALGFRITINGQPGSPAGWWNTSDNMELPSSSLEYRYRPTAPGQYHIECVTHYPGRPQELLSWDISVAP
jgi:hypothetical protein